MFEKVNPAHPDKIADRIAGAIVDLAYFYKNDPKVAVEVLIGHGECYIVIETSCTSLPDYEIEKIVERITGQKMLVFINIVPQNKKLADNQKDKIRCGDNGIFRGEPVSSEEWLLTAIAKDLYEHFPTDGKYLISSTKGLTVCQSNAHMEEIARVVEKHWNFDELDIINPLGYWEGGLSVDTGATNRKLGSDMGASVTGGGLHGKDLSKADVTLNIYAWLKAQYTGRRVELACSIGDDKVDGIPYEDLVEVARNFITQIGGFEKFAEWGLIGCGYKNVFLDAGKTLY